MTNETGSSLSGERLATFSFTLFHILMLSFGWKHIAVLNVAVGNLNMDKSLGMDAEKPQG